MDYIDPRCFRTANGEYVVDRLNVAIEIHKVIIATPAFIYDTKGAAEVAFRHADALLQASGLKWER